MLYLYVDMLLLITLLIKLFNLKKRRKKDMVVVMKMIAARFHRFAVLNSSVLLSLNKSTTSVLQQLVLNFISQKTCTYEALCT